MKNLFLITILITSNTAFASSCDFPWQFASDGSNCGERVEILRAGGCFKLASSQTTRKSYAVLTCLL